MTPPTRILFGLAALLVADSAQASLINVNYTAVSGGPTFTGGACVGSTGDYWNSPTSITGEGVPLAILSTQLKDSNSTLTSAYYSATIPGASFNWGENPDANALFSSRIQTGGVMVHTITGLTVGLYDVYAYGDWNSSVSVNGSAVQSWTDNHGNAQDLTSNGYSQYNLENVDGFLNSNDHGKDAVKFASVSVAEDGILTINVDGAGGMRFSGFQIQSFSPVPEPSSMLGLGCLVGAGALLRTRRRNG